MEFELHNSCPLLQQSLMLEGLKLTDLKKCERAERIFHEGWHRNCNIGKDVCTKLRHGELDITIEETDGYLESDALKHMRLKDCEIAERNFHEAQNFEREVADLSETVPMLNSQDNYSQKLHLNSILQEHGRETFNTVDLSTVDDTTATIVNTIETTNGHFVDVTGQPNILSLQCSTTQTDSQAVDQKLNNSSQTIASDQNTEPSAMPGAMPYQCVICQTDPISNTSTATQTESPSQLNSSSQTSDVYSQCCKCNVYALPLPEQFAIRLKQEVSQRMTMEQLCKIVEQEARDARMQFIAEQNKCMDVQNSMDDLKCELTQERHLAAEYKTRNDELKQALEGAHSMTATLEEQVQSTNLFKGGIDYLLESKLASSKAAEAQTKVEVIQNELVQSRQDVQHLLQRISEVNRDRSEMISSTIHHELLRISDERAKSAELKVHQLEHEIRQLKESASDSTTKYQSTTNIPMPSYNVAPPIPQPIKPSILMSSIAQHKRPTTLSSTQSKALPTSAYTGISTTKVLPDITSLPDFDHMNHLPVSKTSESTPAIDKPLFVTSDSEESDWSSDEDFDDSTQHSVSSITKHWEKMSGAEQHVHFKLPSPVKSKPAIPSKPTIPRKPVIAPPINMLELLNSVEEKAVSFEQKPTKSQLGLNIRIRGASNRRPPTRQKSTAVS